MADTRVGMLIDTSNCIGCRSCQVACKQWKELEADKTKNAGSYENPADLSANLYNRIRFIEKENDKGGVEWLFLNQRCMHCGDAGCMKVCPAPGALERTDDGIVVFNEDKCISCKYCQYACPFDIPRYDTNGKVTKCDLCFERIDAGMAPACAKACPTETLQFGRRSELIAKAKAGNRDIYGEKDLSGLGIMYLLDKKPTDYGLAAAPTIPTSIFLWKDFIKPLGILGFWGSVAGVLLHYVTFGPRQLEDDTENSAIAEVSVENGGQSDE